LYLPFYDRPQAWDNVVGQNMVFNRNTGVAALAIASAAGVAAMVTECKE
jgi:hypothetical protein